MSVAETEIYGSHKEITRRLLSVNFAAIHTTSVTMSHILFSLAAEPHYHEPLRQEIEQIIEEHGLTKDSLAKMVKLDSFMKEVMRTHPLGASEYFSVSRSPSLMPPFPISWFTEKSNG